MWYNSNSKAGKEGRMEKENGNKALRILNIYQKLMNNQTVNKSEEAAAYGVNSKTIQRDIERYPRISRNY